MSSFLGDLDEQRRIRNEQNRVGWLKLVAAGSEDLREDLFTNARQDAEARLIAAIERGEQGKYLQAITRLSSFLVRSRKVTSLSPSFRDCP